MSYARAMLKRDMRAEKRKLEKQAAKKGLMAGWGRTIGGLAAMAFTGGAATPLVAAAMAGAGTAIGGAIGGNQAKITAGDKFFKDEKAELQEKLGKKGSANLMSLLGTDTVSASLSAAAKAGLSQSATNLTAKGKEAVANREGIFDFKNSPFSKGLKAGAKMLPQGDLKSALTVEGLPESMSRVEYLKLIKDRSKDFAVANPDYDLEVW